MELKEKLVSSFIAFENQISLDNTFVHDMRTEAIKRFESKGLSCQKR
jgi:Fe-S cluster assembly protein SufD